LRSKNRIDKSSFTGSKNQKKQKVIMKTEKMMWEGFGFPIILDGVSWVTALFVFLCCFLFPYAYANVEKDLQDFYKLTEQYPANIPWAVTLKKKVLDQKNKNVDVSKGSMISDDQKPLHVVFGCLMHGDEVGCLNPLVKIIQQIANPAGDVPSPLERFSFTFFLGNPEAAKAHQRFVQEDLNRVFDPKRLADSVCGKVVTSESKRAEQIRHLLTDPDTDLFIDLHQTIEPSAQPFYIFRWDPQSVLWARALQGAKVLVTRNAEESFSPGNLSAAELFQDLGKPALTLEMGQKGESKEAADIVKKIFSRLTHLSTVDTNVWKTRDLKSLQTFKRVYSQSFEDPSFQLKPGFQNFSSVRKGQIVGSSSKGSLHSPYDGVLLFPKYPPRDSKGQAQGPLPSQLFQILQEGMP